jgi:hypothetical protein
MKPYGLKRNWNEYEDYARNGRAYRNKTHRKCTKMLHRKERRITKYQLNKEKQCHLES